MTDRMLTLLVKSLKSIIHSRAAEKARLLSPCGQNEATPAQKPAVTSRLFQVAPETLLAITVWLGIFKPASRLWWCSVISGAKYYYRFTNMSLSGARG